jgi:hypothetical protein
MMVGPQCDACGGIEFDTIRTDPIPKPEYINASEYFQQLGKSQVVNSVVVYSHYKAICKKCGAEYNYYC